MNRRLPVPSKRALVVLAWIGGIFAAVLLMVMMFSIVSLSNDYTSLEEQDAASRADRENLHRSLAEQERSLKEANRRLRKAGEKPVPTPDTPEPDGSNSIVINGRDGQDGEDGEDGARGPRGLRGLRGLMGLTGATGTDGFTPPCLFTVEGCKGTKGDPGPVGPVGPQGEDGEDGQPTNFSVAVVGCEGLLIRSISASYDAQTGVLTLTCEGSP